jgi:class 3 adenylate cyclase
MLCPSCRSENLPDALFCVNCGSRIEPPCRTCGTANPPASRFCRKCGKRLADEIPTPGPASDSASAVRVLPEAMPGTDALPEGERKTVTALFADIKGSMELMEDLDPEQARAIVDPALRLMIDAAHRYDGYIVQSTGDGIFALFGAPLAHEDHPQRALYAALRMQEEMRRYAEQLRSEGKPPLQVRVGANTGEAVVRSIRTGEAHAEYTPIGHSTSLAARMQVLAPIGSIAITGEMRKLVEGYFQLKSLGPTRVAGVSGPVAVFEVTGLGPLRTRLQRSMGRGLTKFVGRQAEMQALQRALELARSGHGQIVAAVAEPGVGKSRLFYEFKTISQSGCMVLEALSVSHGKASAFLPLIDLLRNYFEITADDDERKRREKVTGRLLALDRALEDAIPHLYALLGLAGESQPLEETDAQIRKRRTLAAIKRILLRESLNQPLIVMFEDLHWVDDETQEFLNLLADSIGTAKLLMLVNYRPEYRQQWGGKTYYAQLRLDPLGRESADEMLSALLTSPAPAALTAGASPSHDLQVDAPLPTSPAAADVSAAANRERSFADVYVGERVRAGLPLPDQGEGRGVGIEALKRLIIERTEGNPFFMEETVLMLFEEGALVRNGAVKATRSLSQLRIPSTVQAILAARIDRLAPDQKDLLQTLAVVGKEFALSLVRRVVRRPDDDLNRMLSSLQLAEFIYEQPAIADIEFTFKHALTQEVAYNSLLIERRRNLHHRIAQAIESEYAAHLEDHYGELAHHYARSGDGRRAARYLSLIGEQELERSACAQAIEHATAGLELLKTLPSDSERSDLELNLTSTLVRATGFLKGPVEETRKLAVDYKELSLKHGSLPHLARALRPLIIHEINRESGLKAKELAEEAITVAQRLNDPLAEASIRSQLAVILGGLGDSLGAREIGEKALAMAASRPGDSIDVRVIKANSLMLLSGLLFHLGFPDQAFHRCRELAALEVPFSGATKLFAARVALLSGHVSWAREIVNAVPVMTEEDTPDVTRIVSGSFVRALLLLLDKDFQRALALTREGTAIARARGLKLQIGTSMTTMLEACSRAGQAEEGLKAADQYLRELEQSDYRNNEPELLRLKGELLLLSDAAATQSEAESCFRRAVGLANSGSAKTFELRATMSLARLLAKQGKREEARAMLAQIYGWFTEGFDTPDLKEAKALLDKLNAWERGH